MSPTGSFFALDGETVLPTPHTRGPWSADHQHGGPPAALLGRALHKTARAEGKSVPARITFEFLRPVPIQPLVLEIDVLRPGKTALTLVASLFDAETKTERMRGIGLFLAPAPLSLPESVRRESSGISEVPGPEDSAPFVFPFFQTEIGYHRAMEVRMARGTFGEGATTSWMRARVSLIEGEEPSPLDRVLLASDSGNGLSPILDFSAYTFINPDLTVVLRRLPRGEWVGLSSKTVLGEEGTGVAGSDLFDEEGEFGVALQSLIVRAR